MSGCSDDQIVVPINQACTYPEVGPYEPVPYAEYPIGDSYAAFRTYILLTENALASCNLQAKTYYEALTSHE